MAPSSDMAPVKSLHDFQLDGLKALTALIAASPYGTLENAVAALTIFSHPDTVEQTQCRPLVRTVRNLARRGEIGELNGQQIGFDDNTSPTHTFLWCNGLARPKDVQFNHVYPVSQDPEGYTSLANICMGPAFLAKLTDTHPHVRRLLEYRAFKLYGWHPNACDPPTAPDVYEELAWADTLPAVNDVRAVLIASMAKRPKSRTSAFARRLGWLFGEPSMAAVEAAINAEDPADED